MLQKPIRIIVHGRVANFFVKKIFTSFEKLFVADQLRWLGVGRVGRRLVAISRVTNIKIFVKRYLKSYIN